MPPRNKKWRPLPEEPVAASAWDPVFAERGHCIPILAQSCFHSLQSSPARHRCPAWGFPFPGRPEEFSFWTRISPGSGLAPLYFSLDGAS